MQHHRIDQPTTNPGVTTPADKREALRQLLTGYGPYRRDQLRLKLLSKAALLRDEADAVRRAQGRFARLARPGGAPDASGNRCVELVAEAAELESMAHLVAGSDAQPVRRQRDGGRDRPRHGEQLGLGHGG